MLIIFDLDDTLIDTSGSITPFKLKRALEQMIHSGLVIADLSSALEELKQLNSKVLYTREALQEFLQKIDAPKEFLSIGIKEIYENLDLPERIEMRTGAKEILENLQKEHSLAIVTAGYSLLQWEKLKKAGVDTSLFSKIVVSPNYDKKPHYLAIMQEGGYTPIQTIVCGDRIGVDLLPAKQLGCTTVHIEGGRESASGSDFTIGQLFELKGIVQRLSNYQ